MGTKFAWFPFLMTFFSPIFFILFKFNQLSGP